MSLLPHNIKTGDLHRISSQWLIGVWLVALPCLIFGQNTAELKDLHKKYEETVTTIEQNPKENRVKLQGLVPQFEKKEDWIYYYKSLIEIAWSYNLENQYTPALQAIDLAISDFKTRRPGAYFLVKLGDAYLNKGIILNNANRYSEVLSTYQQALNAYAQMEEGDYDFENQEKYFAYCYNNIAKNYSQEREFELALEYFDKAIVSKTKIFGANHQSTLNTVRLKADLYFELGYLNKALKMHENALAVEQKENDVEGIAHSYEKISKVYQRKRDFKTAEEYIRKAVSVYNTLGFEKKSNKSYTLHQMGNVLKDGGKYAESIPWFEESILLKNEIFGVPNYKSALSTMNIGKAYTYLNQYDKGLKYYKKTWQMFDALLEPKHPRYVELWLSMGNCYLSAGQSEKAHDLFTRSYNLAKEKTPEKSYDRALSCLNLAKTTKDPDEALLLCQEGFWELTKDFSYEGVKANPATNNIFSEYYGLLLFIRKGAIFQKKYQQTKDKTNLELALQTYQSASELVDYSRQSFFTESAKQFLGKDARVIYEEATKVAFALYELEPDSRYVNIAFQMMEKSRSMILLEALQTGAATKIAKIPDSLAIQKQQFQKQLLELETQFQLVEKDDLRAQELNDEIFAIKENQRRFEAAIVKNYPAMAQVESELDILTAGDVQSKLAPNEVLLEYLITDSALFVVKILNTESHFFKQSHQANPESQIVDFIKLINDNQLARNKGAALEVYQDFTEKSAKLYDQILGFALNGSDGKLILIPDLYMNYLPFELLLSNKKFNSQQVNYATLPYVFKTHTIRYSFSANLQFQEFISPQHNREVLAFAPKYEGKANPILATREGFTALSQTFKEVESIGGLLEGTVKTGETANEKNFKSLADNFGILHLAMHAYTNEENPMLSGLIFSENEDEEDDILHAYELYGMQLNAQLAVLSACNTGSGKFEKGEGVMSLARGFRQAGVPNIVMSLWQADDESTRIIMENFYRYLKSGLAIDDALRFAKLDFLETHSKTFPHYWSAFVVMGNDTPISFIQASQKWYWLAGIGILLIFFLYIAIMLLKVTPKISGLLSTE